ncbi:hypothetical protein J6590_065186 [Homalodisca vitripennis]|nr:hypothetical protein J6590_065186 [Homalodisca vitripennis]
MEDPPPSPLSLPLTTTVMSSAFLYKKGAMSVFTLNENPPVISAGFGGVTPHF